MKQYYKFGWAIIIALVLVVFASISYYLESELKTWMQDIVREESLEDAKTISSVLANLSSDFTPETLDPLLDKINQNSRYRVTVIDSTGVVLADTKLTLDEVFSIDNHRDRPEFLSATDQLAGESIRYSKTLKQKMLYLAIPFKATGFTGFIRISHSLADIDTYTDKLRSIQQTVALIGLAILGIISFISYGFIQKNNELQKKKLRKKVKQKTKSLVEMQKFSEKLAACNSINELSEVVASTMLILFPSSSGALSITHPSLDQNEVIAHWGKHWSGEALYPPEQCWAFRKGSPYISKSNSVETKCKHMNISHQKTSVCVPLLAQSIAIGVLHIVFEKSCSKDAKNRFVTIADHLSLAVANINLRESLKRQAIRDPLTNLYNRRFLDEALKNELLRAQRNQQSLAVLMIDVDHFKKFNDSFGHDAGDYTLQQVGKTLLNLVRGEDIACRFGGEEFTVVFPNITNDDLIKRANAILQAVKDIELMFKNKTLEPITLSIGVASYPEHETTAEGLISAADKALYQAKANGRNQVVMA